MDPDPLARALAAPVESLRLQELAQGKKNAVILISDGTRLCPSHLLLPRLLDELNAGGIPDGRIRIIVALGMHRLHTRDELEQLAGPEVYRRVEVRNHSALEEDCIYLGETSRGTPVAVNRHFVEAELRIATGNIEPHRLAGMSGGVKAVIPGCASKRCIEANHSLSRTNKARPGFVDNAVHEDLEEAQRFVPIHYLLNVVVNHRKEILAAAAGSPLPVHRSLSEQASKIFFVEAPDERYDLTVVSAGGAPKDMQLYQAVKTLQNASDITKPGGSILLLAECREHYGNGVMQLWAETMEDRQAVLQALERQFVLGAHKLEHLYKINGKHRVWLHSSMPNPLLELMGFQTGGDRLQDTLDMILERPWPSGGRPRTALMPYGALTFPRSEQAST